MAVPVDLTRPERGVYRCGIASKRSFTRDDDGDRWPPDFQTFSAFNNNRTNRCCENRMITERRSLSSITERSLKGEWRLTNVAAKIRRAVQTVVGTTRGIRSVASDNIIFECPKRNGVYNNRATGGGRTVDFPRISTYCKTFQRCSLHVRKISLQKCIREL